MAHSSAARTNLSSNSVQIDGRTILGEGAFRIAYAGTFIGGNRNTQEAVCKSFKNKYRIMETEYYQHDFAIADRAIEYAEDWNEICPHKKELLMTRGTVHTLGHVKYLVEPLIRNFTKFTSNNGWIADEADVGWTVLAMEAFTHYTYHRSGGSLIVCDLQGRYRHDRFNDRRCRFELTDPAICSRKRLYGPTDLGEKGIESFFNNHVCNQFCNIDGHWQRPRQTRQWFSASTSTSMMRSTESYKLNVAYRATFVHGLGGILEENNLPDYSDDDSYDSW